MESDIISLSPSFTVLDGILHDNVVHASHQFTNHGQDLLAAMSRGVAYKKLIILANARGVPLSQLNNLLGCINMLGGLQRTRIGMAHLYAWRTGLRGLLLGILHAPLSWRRPTNSLWLFAGILRATAAVTVAIIVVCGLVSSMHLYSFIVVLQVAFFGWALFVTSIYVHELGHIHILRHIGVTADILQNGLRFGIIHRKVSPIFEIVSAITGPLTGVLYCTAVYIVTLISQAHILAYLCLVILLFHLCSLLPWCGDGQSLYKAIHHRKNI